MTRRALTVLATLAATQAVAIAPAAAAESDVRPCVTAHELWTTPGGLSRPQVERRWDVGGKGERLITVMGPGWAYPMCDVARSVRFALAQFVPGRGLVLVGEVTTGEDQ